MAARKKVEPLLAYGAVTLGEDPSPLDQLREDLIESGIEVLNAQAALAAAMDHMMTLAEEADNAFDDDEVDALSRETAVRAGLIVEAAETA